MKKLLLLLFLICATGIVAQDITNAQRDLRSGIMLFLKEEGFMPELDNDGDIKFKKEGSMYYVILDPKDTSPMYIVLCHQYKYDNIYTKEKVLKAQNEINLYKGVKLICFEKNYSFRAEMYLVDAEHFKYTFYKLMKQLGSMEQELEQNCKF